MGKTVWETIIFVWDQGHTLCFIILCITYIDYIHNEKQYKRTKTRISENKYEKKKKKLLK